LLLLLYRLIIKAKHLVWLRGVSEIRLLLRRSSEIQLLLRTGKSIWDIAGPWFR
jgi:hypothetical protein